MLRGFVTGGAWGLIAATLGVTTASLLAPQPPGNAPPGEPLVVMTQAEAADVVVDLPAPDVAMTNDKAEPLAAPVATPAPPAAVTAADTDTQIADTAPASPPVIAIADALLAEPASGGLPAPAAPALDTPVIPNPQAPAPVTPASEADLILSTAPALPPAPPEPQPEPESQEPMAVIPVIPQADALPVIVAPAAVSVEPGMVAAPATLPEQSGQTSPAQPDVADVLSEARGPADPAVLPDAAVTGGVAPETQVAAAVVPVVVPTVDPQAAPVPLDLPQIAPEPLPESAPEAVLNPDQLPPVEILTPELAQSDLAQSDLAQTDPVLTAPPPSRIVLQGDAASLPQVAGGVRVNRPETSAVLIPDEAQPVAPVAEIVTEGPALTQFAAPFSNPDGKPLMSVILIDDGAIAGLSDTLADVPFPVTIAINPGDPDATARMQVYRDRGIEVLAIATLPQGAQPSDVEVTLEAVFATLPQAVGLIDPGDGQVQSSTAVTGQTLARLAADGRGLVVFSDGLNPALRAAATASVPAVEVARDLDGHGQDAGTIRRFLDNAAFQARQTSGIVLLARLRPETISALILWGAENRAGQVALAPISVILSQ